MATARFYCPEYYPTKPTDLTMTTYDCSGHGHGIGTAQAAGFLFAGGAYYRAAEMLDYFATAETWTEFLALCASADGEWRVALPRAQEVWLAVDARASQRWYYRMGGGRLTVADNGFELTPSGTSCTWDEEACLFFLRWGFAPHDQTLLEGLHRLPAEHALRYRADGEVAPVAYAGMRPALGTEDISYTEAKAKLTDHLHQAGQRLIRHLDGRPAVIPLTGGYDSRMIAYLLASHGYRNVVAMNYGRVDNSDARRGAEIARRLGLPYHFVESTQADALDYTDDPQWHDYMHYMTGLSSCYYYQEYRPAQSVAELVPGSIVLPGHQGDDLGGSQMTSTALGRWTHGTADALARYLYGHQVMHQSFSAGQRRRLIDIHRRVVARYPEDLPPWQRIETFMQRERISKYNLNSQASWRYHGLETAGLFLDRALADYAYRLPWSYRYGKRLYEEVVLELYDQAGILLPDDTRLLDRLSSPSYRLRQCIKGCLGGWRPRRDLFAGDLIGFRELMQPVLRETRQDGRFRPRTVNGLSFAWYLLRMERHLGKALPKGLFR